MSALPDGTTPTCSPRLREDPVLASGAFTSILFPKEIGPLEEQAPDFFGDLCLDQIVAGIAAGREEYDLSPFFLTRLQDLDAITWRQEVMRDVESDAVRNAIGRFADRMRHMRRRLENARTGQYERANQRCVLAAAASYVEAIGGLAGDFRRANPSSRGLRSFLDFLLGYLDSEPFRGLAADAQAVEAELDAIRYAVYLHDGVVIVRNYEGEEDYTTTIEETFRRFWQEDGKEPRFRLSGEGGMNHIEAQIVDRVALLEPDAFAALADFARAHANFVDPRLARFDREFQFYAGCLAFVEPVRSVGLPFCYPRLSRGRKDIAVRDAYDLALAARLSRAGGEVVPNDFTLDGPERFLVVTGPNQGGKTTFARLFGQIHYLAALGCPVPGREARLLLCDRIFTHFEREEKTTTLRGRLEDELIRVRDTLDQATSESVVIINEMFSSTTLDDALLLGRAVLSRLSRRGALGVCVTFLDELSRMGEETVSLVAAVDPHEPEHRTFRIERRPADGLAHALAIAEKHRLTHRQILERIPE